MKEKTFEELIKGEFNIKLMDESDWNNIQFSALDMREFGKQVREVTKKEDAEIADKYKAPHIAEAILNTATDRIKTDL